MSQLMLNSQLHVLLIYTYLCETQVSAGKVLKCVDPRQQLSIVSPHTYRHHFLYFQNKSVKNVQVSHSCSQLFSADCSSTCSRCCHLGNRCTKLHMTSMLRNNNIIGKIDLASCETGFCKLFVVNFS